MNTLKKFDKMFGKYVGIAFSLLLIWIFKNDSGNLTYQVFFMSLLVSGLILRELVVKHKNKINKPLLALRFGTKFHNCDNSGNTAIAESYKRS